MPEYLKWAHTAVLKATVRRSKATLLYAPSIGGSNKIYLKILGDGLDRQKPFWYNLWFLMVILTFKNDKKFLKF